MSISKKAIIAFVKELFRFLRIRAEGLGVYFVTKKKITELHKEFFEDPTPTDCISFPIDEFYLGEIFICPNVAKSYAKKKKMDPYEEVKLYIIHSILHLIGFDDMTPGKKRIMQKKEKQCMHHMLASKIF